MKNTRPNNASFLNKLKKTKQLKLIVFVLMFAAVGSYFVFRSFANPISPTYFGRATPCAISGSGNPSSYITVKFADGNSKNVPTDANGGFVYTEGNTNAMQSVEFILDPSTNGWQKGTGEYGGCSKGYAYTTPCYIGGKVARGAKVQISYVIKPTDSPKYIYTQGDEVGYFFEAYPGTYGSTVYNVNVRTGDNYSELLAWGGWGPCQDLKSVDPKKPLDITR